MTDPIGTLYSFRRCPYAMRARFAILRAGLSVELREVDLKHKPAALLAASAKGTVPVLALNDGRVIDESIDIVDYVSSLPEGRALQLAPAQQAVAMDFMETLASQFIPACREYKYSADAEVQLAARERGMAWLMQLAAQLNRSNGPSIFGAQETTLDINIMPMVRQYRLVDPEWFDAQPMPALLAWLAGYQSSEVMQRMMVKHAPWTPEQAVVVLQ